MPVVKGKVVEIKPQTKLEKILFEKRKKLDIYFIALQIMIYFKGKNPLKKVSPPPKIKNHNL